MIGKRIEKYRKNSNLTQEELSQKVGMKQTLISRIERNKRKVSSDEVVLFAKALFISTNVLLGIDEDNFEGKS